MALRRFVCEPNRLMYGRFDGQGCSENGVWFELSHLPDGGQLSSFSDGLSAAAEASRSYFPVALVSSEIFMIWSARR